MKLAVQGERGSCENKEVSMAADTGIERGITNIRLPLVPDLDGIKEKW